MIKSTPDVIAELTSRVSDKRLEEFQVSDTLFLSFILYITITYRTIFQQRWDTSDSQYQSLHSYIEYKKLDNFLSEVSGIKGKGYELWRYTLIDDKKHLPRNSAEAMLAIWGICVQIAESRLTESRSVSMLDQTLRSILINKLSQIFQGQCIEIQLNSDSVEQRLLDIGLEAYTEMFQGKNVLNVFAAILHHYGCNGSHGLSDLPDHLSKAIYIWIEKVSNFNEKPGISSLRVFIERAQGNTWVGESIRWNSDSRRFENVPWSLESIPDKTIPLDAITIELPNRLHELKVIANECGYTTRENRSFTSPQNFDKDDYFRTLEISESGTLEPVITVWQKPRYTSEFSFVVEQTLSKIEKPVQEWVKINQFLAEFGEFRRVD